MKPILLDTNAYVELLSGNKSVLKHLETSACIYMSIFVIAELFTGFKTGSKEKENLSVLNNFLSNPKIKIINATIKTSSIFSEIKHYLKTIGKPIPINDVWIASHAFEYNSKLVTFDKHFQFIPKIEIWDNF